MTSPNKQMPLLSIWRWFDPRGRDIGTWAFILNRISAISLTVYLFLHLIILRKLALGPQAYDSFVVFMKNPLFIAGELLVIVAGIYHALNGLRVVVTSFGIGVGYQKILSLIVFTITIIACVVFALRMFVII
jgi:succinate dehydrogenase / fumarate reductase cytochrome b subunit